jgi:hypothetical protein
MFPCLREFSLRAVTPYVYNVWLGPWLVDLITPGRRDNGQTIATLGGIQVSNTPVLLTSLLVPRIISMRDI